MPDETHDEPLTLPLGEPAEPAPDAPHDAAAHGEAPPLDVSGGDLISLDDAPPPEETRPPAQPAPPLALLVCAGVILALLLAVILDLKALGRARDAVAAAHQRVQAAEKNFAAAQQELAQLKALPPVHNGCSDLADYVDAPSMRRLNLHGEGKGKNADANFYLPLQGEGCLIITGALPPGVPVLWQLSGAAHKLAALPKSGEPRVAPAGLQSGKGTLVVTMEKSADAKSPSADAILIGKVE
jgi:hypothetical protein